ncbi:MAG: hypothetical protein LBR28_02690 [Bacteroidales bacterium]|jgi:hypothetical protein|nr:hypothetical protein [Bacteroidales bacterium]
MKKANLVFALLIIVVVCSSCATMFSGSKKSVTFDANIKVDKPVTLTVDGYAYRNVTLPYVAQVRRGFSPSQAKLEVEGYESSHVMINKTFNATTLLNLLSWNLLGFLIDAASGSMMKPDYNSYEFYLVKPE